MISMQSGWWVLSAILAFYALVRTSDLERASVVTRCHKSLLRLCRKTLGVSHEGRYDYRAWANPEVPLEAIRVGKRNRQSGKSDRK